MAEVVENPRLRHGLQLLQQRRSLSAEDLRSLKLTADDFRDNPKVSFENGVLRWRGILDRDGIMNLCRSEGALQITEEILNSYPEAVSDIWNLVQEKKVRMLIRDDFKKPSSQLAKDVIRGGLPPDVAIMSAKGEEKSPIHGLCGLYQAMPQTHHNKNVYVNRQTGFAIFYHGDQLGHWRNGWILAPKLGAKEKFAFAMGNLKTPEKAERWMANSHKELKISCVSVELLSWVLYPLQEGPKPWAGHEDIAGELREMWRKQLPLPRLHEIMTVCGIQTRRSVSPSEGGEGGQGTKVEPAAKRKRQESGDGGLGRGGSRRKLANDHLDLSEFKE